MRIRTIKPAFFLHDGLFDLEKSTRLPVRVAFIGLWCAADREGRFEWRPRRLKPCILPHDNLDFGAVLDALAGAGFIVRYGPNGEFGFIPSFSTHQCINVRESDSILPEPARDTCTHVHAHASTCGREGKGKEGNGVYVHAPTAEPVSVPPARTTAAVAATAGNGKFSPPSKEEADLHAAKIGLPPVEVEKFLSYYAANGWRVGRNPMKNWQAAMTHWRTNWQARGGNVAEQPATWQEQEAQDLIRFANRIEGEKR